MSNSEQQKIQRVLARAGSRILTIDELARVSAGQNPTFVFTHINGDVTRD